MDLSKNNNFLTEEPINYIARTEKEGAVFVHFYHENWREATSTPTASTFELFC